MNIKTFSICSLIIFIALQLVSCANNSHPTAMIIPTSLSTPTPTATLAPSATPTEFPILVPTVELKDTVATSDITVTLSDSIKNRDVNTFHSLRINPDSGYNVPESIRTYLGTFEWINYVHHYRELTQAEYDALNPSKKCVTLTIPMNGNVNIQPTKWKNVCVVEPDYYIELVSSIYGKERMLESPKYLSDETFVNGVHVEVNSTKVTIFVIPEKLTFGSISSDIIEQTKDKEVEFAVVKALALVLGDSKIEDVRKNNHYDASISVDHVIKEDRRPWEYIDKLLGEQGYYNLGSSVLVTSDMNQYVLQELNKAKPWFWIDH